MTVEARSPQRDYDLCIEATPLPRPSSDVVFQQVEGEVVLVHLRTNRIFALNPTGARFWELLAAGNTRPQILAQLAQEFDVETPEVEREIEKILSALAAEKLVT